MKKIIILLSCGYLLSIAACKRKEIDISAVTLKSRLVVNALVNDQDKISISVSQSTTIQDSVKPAPISNATVVITDGNGSKTNCVYNLLNDKYECNIVAKSGEYFAVTVSAPGFAQAFAELRIPGKSSINKTVWKDSTGFDSSGYPLGRLSVKINDNGGEKNYYRINLFYYKTGLGEWVVMKPALEDAEFENQALKTEDGGIIFKDNTFNGKQRTVNFITQFGFSSQSPKFMAVVENLSEPYYNYFKSLDDYKNNSGIFNEPIPVFSNIRNGLGIFAGSSIQRDTIQ